MSGNNSGNKMSSSDASRIQSSEAKSGNDAGFAARAQSAAAQNNNAGAQTGGGKAGGAGGRSGSEKK